MNYENEAHPRPVQPHPPLSEYYQKPAERRHFVDGLFDHTAVHYDWINRMMSLGSGVRYRGQALKRAGLREGNSVLDVCTGSGQMARAALDVVGKTGCVFGLDASMGMLVEARGFVSIPLTKGYVEHLPVADGSVDFVTMGYALRHVADLRATFGQYLRVLRTNGTLVILEFTRPRSRPVYWFSRIYLRNVMPAMARLRSRKAQTLMHYFWDTIENCVSPETILETLAGAGFDQPRRRCLFDCFSEYTARKPRE